MNIAVCRGVTRQHFFNRDSLILVQSFFRCARAESSSKGFLVYPLVLAMSQVRQIEDVVRESSLFERLRKSSSEMKVTDQIKQRYYYTSLSSNSFLRMNNLKLVSV